jgi:hypothetical protein
VPLSGEQKDFLKSAPAKRVPGNASASPVRKGSRKPVPLSGEEEDFLNSAPTKRVPGNASPSPKPALLSEEEEDFLDSAPAKRVPGNASPIAVKKRPSNDRPIAKPDRTEEEDEDLPFQKGPPKGVGAITVQKHPPGGGSEEEEDLGHPLPRVPGFRSTQAEVEAFLARKCAESEAWATAVRAVAPRLPPNAV